MFKQRDSSSKMKNHHGKWMAATFSKFYGKMWDSFHVEFLF